MFIDEVILIGYGDDLVLIYVINADGFEYLRFNEMTHSCFCHYRNPDIPSGRLSDLGLVNVCDLANNNQLILGLATSSSFQILSINIKLEHENYSIWRTTINSALETSDLESFVLAPAPPAETRAVTPPTTPPTFQIILRRFGAKRKSPGSSGLWKGAFTPRHQNQWVHVPPTPGALLNQRWRFITSM
ncbi:hypothetical protein LXL04_010632 [Taraxacum kok-saghyz]